MLYLLGLLGLYLLLYGLRYLVTFLQLRKLNFQYPALSLQPKTAMPPYLGELLKPAVKELKQFGFKPCSYVQMLTTLKLEPPTSNYLLLYHPELKTYATLTAKLLAEPADLFDVEFYSLSKTKALLVTMNGKAHSLLGEIPQTTVQDAYAVDLVGQWQMHQQQIEQWRTAGQDLVGLAPELFLRLLESRFHGQLNELVQQGQLVPAPTGELRM
jgi:hypothetical protein